MSYLGDIPSQQTLDFEFTTITTTGAPTQLAGSPVISVYKSNSTTQTTTGVTLTVDFDAVTGLNHVRIVTTDAFYATATDYRAVITTGTVGGTSVVGYVVAEFSIENRTQKADVTKWLGTAAATPTVAGVPEVDVTHWNGTAVATPDTAGYPKTTIKDGTGTGELDTASGKVLLQNDAITAAALAADAVTEIQTGLSTVTAAQVNAEVVDVIFTDTQAELSGVPAANAALAAKLNFIFMALRNQQITSTTEDKIHNDAGSAIGTGAVTDDGTIYTRGKYA